MSGVKRIRIEPSARERAEVARAAARRAAEEVLVPAAALPVKEVSPDKASSLAPIEATVRRAARVSALLAACEALRIPLDAELSLAAKAVRSFSTNPTLAGAPGAEGALSALSSSHLARALEARRKRLARALERAAEPSMQAELDAFRAGLSDDLRILRERVETDGFGRETRPLAFEALGALDAFLRARAEARVVLVCRGGEATGRRATPLRFDPLRRAVVATLEDEHGVFARIAETVVDWIALGGDEGDLVEMKGPAEWDGPACVHGGHGDVLRALRAQGVPATLYGEDGIELFPNEPPDAGSGALVVLAATGSGEAKGFS